MRPIFEHEPDQRVLHNFLSEQARRNPDAPWILHNGERMTFGAAEDAVAACAGGFRRMGVEAGDIVALMLDSTADYITYVLALSRIGAIHMVVNTAYKGEFLARLLDHVEPKAIVVEAAYAPQVGEVVDRTTAKTVVIRGTTDAVVKGRDVIDAAELRVVGPWKNRADVRPGDCASIMYTSGTTGRSKGVMLSHNYWYTATVAMAQGRDINETDVFHCCTPMFHAGAWLLNVYPSLLYGLRMGLMDRFQVASFWESVKEYGATQLFTIGAMHMWLWALPRGEHDAKNSARVWTAIPVPPDLWNDFQERYGLEALYSAYGQTEAMPATTTNVRRPCKPGSAGWPQPNLEIRIVDESDRPVPPDTVGEIVVRPREPDTMFSAYYRDPEAALKAFRNLWYHTGDFGRMDADGELFFVDRKDDYLRRRGENISSLEVEEVIRQHPAVAAVAVHGVPSEHTEDEVKACIVLNPGADTSEAALAEFFSANLPYFAVPRFIELLDELPHTPTGRVQKFILRERGVTARTWDAKVTTGGTAR